MLFPSGKVTYIPGLAGFISCRGARHDIIIHDRVETTAGVRY